MQAHVLLYGIAWTVVPRLGKRVQLMPITEISLASQTMFAELLQRALDAEFDEMYSEKGNFVRVRSKGRMYWQFRIGAGKKRKQIYVGPVADKSITDRVERFADIKSDFKGGRRWSEHSAPPVSQRADQIKSAKDVAQAAVLIEALAKRRPLELANAWQTAWDSGPKWREKLESGRLRLPQEAQAALQYVAEARRDSKRRRNKNQPRLFSL